MILRRQKPNHEQHEFTLIGKTTVSDRHRIRVRVRVSSRVRVAVRFSSLSLTFNRSHNPPTSISPRLDFSSTLSQHTFFIYGHSCSPTYPLLFENHKLLF